MSDIKSSLFIEIVLAIIQLLRLFFYGGPLPSINLWTEENSTRENKDIDTSYTVENSKQNDDISTRYTAENSKLKDVVSRLSAEISKSKGDNYNTTGLTADVMTEISKLKDDIAKLTAEIWKSKVDSTARLTTEISNLKDDISTSRTAEISKLKDDIATRLTASDVMTEISKLKDDISTTRATEISNLKDDISSRLSAEISKSNDDIYTRLTAHVTTENSKLTDDFSSKLRQTTEISRLKTLSIDTNLYVKGDIIFDGDNKWIIHTPDDGRKTLYMARWENGNWNWGSQFHWP